MNSVNEVVLNFLLNSIWQITAIFLLAGFGTYLLKNCSAHYRHIVWTAALFLCLMVPVTHVMPAGTVSVSPAKEITTSTPDEDTPVVDHTRGRSSQVVVNATARNMQLVSATYLLFLAFVAIRFVRLWNSNVKLRRSISFDELPYQMTNAMTHCMALFGVENVRLARSRTARVPYTLGVWRPLIVLPDSFCGDVDQETLLSVIAHEMAHVRRRDFLTKLICELVSLPISFVPFTFFIKRRIERERELACDELVTQQVLQPETYARSLLRAADLSLFQAPKGVMLSVFDGRMLEERIRQLARNRSFSRWAGRTITAAVLSALCLSSVVASAFGFSLQAPLDLPVLLATPAGPVSTLPQHEQPPRTAKPDASPVATRPTSSDAQELARSACDAGRNRNLEAIPSLVSMLDDERKTEPLACWNTGRWSPALDTFKHPSPGEEAALALASMGRPAFAPLVEQLDSANAATRRNAAWAIGELTNMLPGERAGAGPKLIALLGDTDAWVRMAAARAIGEVRDRRASETLIVTLSDGDWRVRRLAAWALNEMKEEKAVAALCNLLVRDSRADVRTAAAEALGEIGSADALPSLQQALNDTEPDVRAKASWAIAEIED